MKKRKSITPNGEKATPLLTITVDVLNDFINTIGIRRAESGGAFGRNEDGRVINNFHFDKSSSNSAVTYSPDYKTLNQLFSDEWNPKGVRFSGFVHSHPGRMSRPSYGDEIYAERILKAIDDLDYLWLPIINTVPDTGEFRFTPWAAFPLEKGVEIVRGKVRVVQDTALKSMELSGLNFDEVLKLNGDLDEIVIDGKRISLKDTRTDIDSYRSRSRTSSTLTMDKPFNVKIPVNRKEDIQNTFNIENTFNRVKYVYDLDLMRNSRIIAVGAGGAASWLEELARTGLGQFVLIDPDIVSETNLATQQTYRRDIGRYKVDCIAERIRDINPMTKAVALNKSLDDLSDEEIKRLAVDPIDDRQTHQTIICGLTDSFFAQARVNRIALQFGLPSLCAQVYKEGRGAEVTFTYPGVTPACHRCILSSRYSYFIEEKRNNNVTSHGTPIFSTTRLNAIKGFVILAMIHHGTDHPRWGNMLERIGKRNLIQIRMDPDFTEMIGIAVFDKVFQEADKERLFFDEVVWLPQDQECLRTGYPNCPDCGGTGDLRDSISSFENTQHLSISKKMEKVER